MSNHRIFPGAVVRWVLVCLALASCTSLRPAATEQRTEQASAQRDSTGTDRSYTEQLRLTPVLAAADEVGFETQLEVQASGQLKPVTYVSRGRRATVSLKVDAQGKVTGKCGCEAEKAIITSLDRQLIEKQKQVQQQATTRYITRATATTVRQPYTAWYDWLARFVAIGLVALLLGLYLFHRFYPKAHE